MYVVAITGASGTILGLRLVEQILLAGKEVSVVISPSGWTTLSHEILKNETGPTTLAEVLARLFPQLDLANFSEYDADDYYAPPASGTALVEAVLVVPCSMKTLSAVATGYADSLITRAVDVSLKEGRQTILVPRETPMSLVHLKNLVAAKEAGAQVLMPVPGFYTYPRTIEDVIDFITAKILNLLSIPQHLLKPWGR